MGKKEKSNNSAGDGKLVLKLSKGISAGLSVKELDGKLGEILSEISRTRPTGLKRVHESVTLLKDQPELINTLIKRYGSLVPDDFESRLLHLSFMGQLQHPESLKFLRSVVWAPLPEDDEKNYNDGIPGRGYEEMLMAKAVHGIAYLRSKESDKELIKIMLEHESKHVKITAINSYMWNHGDNKEAAANLYKILPGEYHPYVERPCYHRNINVEEFNKRNIDWYNKWMKGKGKNNYRKEVNK